MSWVVHALYLMFSSAVQYCQGTARFRPSAATHRHRPAGAQPPTRGCTTTTPAGAQPQRARGPFTFLTPRYAPADSRSLLFGSLVV